MTRRDEGPRDACEAAGVTPWDALPPVPLSRHCAAGECGACRGDSWDPVDDVPADCPDLCHGIAAQALHLEATGIVSMAAIRAALEQEFTLSPGTLDPERAIHPRAADRCACGHLGRDHAWDPNGDWCETPGCTCDGVE